MNNLGVTLLLMELHFNLIFMCVKSRGVNILIYIVHGVSSLCDVLMLKLWVKIEQNILCPSGCF